MQEQTQQKKDQNMFSRRTTVGVVKSALSGGARFKKYDSSVIKHFYKPEHIGTLDKKNTNVGTGNHGSPACGDMARIQIEYCDDTKLIKDVAFKTFGCGSAIAASSYACSLLVGKDLNQVLEVRNQKIAGDLKLPPVKKHCRYDLGLIQIGYDSTARLRVILFFKTVLFFIFRLSFAQF